MNRRAGFSLLELLISLAITAFIIAAIGSSLNLGILTMRAADSREELIDPLILRSQLRLWLIEAASPIFESELPAEFIGTADHLIFSSTAPVEFAPGAAGLRIRVQQTEAGLDLIAMPLRPNGTTIEEITEPVLLDADGVSFGYYDGLTAAWLETWSDLNRLPTLVRIEADPESRPDWPTFTVRLLRAGT